ncbi:tryptophan-rich sensory protein [Fulvivirga lutimaris]|uniref:tryptophan-rich sensory protein n=1 Tax=Fulvivirga lutimaris TaxID=1819566 RepID=UPI0012BD0BB3|nr:tryptophan-rich sensory protein [Fulvivirga lutimaris]MTI39501.1 tryptophan-rich sensory protein [Fulvivirga lutimaris]
MSSGYKILNRLKNQWRGLLVLESVLWLVGLMSLVYVINSKYGIGLGNVHLILVLVPIYTLLLLYFKPWKVDIKRSAQWVDLKLEDAENSAYLLISDTSSLSFLATLQQQRISNRIAQMAKQIYPPLHLLRMLGPFVIMVLISWVINISPAFESLHPNNDNQNTSPIIFNSADTTVKKEPAKILTQTVSVRPPAYTGLKSTSSAQMNVAALIGSRVNWLLEFNQPINKVLIETVGGSQFNFTKRNDKYQVSLSLEESGFYKFVFFDEAETRYESDIYQLIAIEDEVPVAEITDLNRFTQLEIEDPKDVMFTTEMRDDYGLAAASIIATVSKGSGESVKFREEQLEFDKPISMGSKSAVRKKSINLDDLKMEPGDELYFYVEVFDIKQPNPNRTRTETYFVSIRDTTEIEFTLEGSLGVDLMPDYFRSQRQLIIDTEKLIKNKPTLAKKDFNFTSNELGFDQKALRLKYGQFMGEEFETGITEETQEMVEEGLGETQDENDPLAAYSHAHDTENEHNLVPEEEQEDEDDPLKAYMHDHDDPEETTLYIASIKGKLRAAMNEMWDAELYLRLFEPHKSLPYQYKALELIKEIKNHARIYVHRMGFDPPPIKEEKRLTGDLEKVETLTRFNENENKEIKYPAILAALNYIEQLKASVTMDYDATIFKKAGDELGGIAIESPVKYLDALQNLQKLSIRKVEQDELPKILVKVQNQLHQAIPENLPTPVTKASSKDALTKLYLNQLNKTAND